jgi:crotonobetainyl-CoA:carnitine CoA-transferase CaiB-like acyl-CoA transferase
MTALGDITILDLSHALAGPFSSTMLAEFGAQIIKVETPGRGDLTRSWGPPFYPGRQSAYFVHLNPNKQSVEIDLKHPEGRRLVLELAERVDVLLENLRIGTADALGIGYEAVRARNDRIVYCSISGFGQTGPYRDRAALDLVAQAESGLVSVTGEAGGRGVRAGISLADITAGMYAAFGILTALHARTLTGRGQFVDVSMFEGQLGLLRNVLGAYCADGIVPVPTGNVYPTLFPYQTFRTRTRDIGIGIPSDKLWQSLCGALDLTIGDDSRYATNADRSANHVSLVATLESVFLTRSYEEWEPLLLAAGVPVGAINTIDRVVEHPQVVAREVLVDCEHPVAGTLRMLGPAVRLSDTPGSVRHAAPLLGQHTDEVLRERLGLADEELDRLRRAGAIGPPRASSS